MPRLNAPINSLVEGPDEDLGYQNNALTEILVFPREHLVSNAGQQEKLISAVVRGDPNLLSLPREDSPTIEEARIDFLQSLAKGKVDLEDLKHIIEYIVPPVFKEEDRKEPRMLYNRVITDSSFRYLLGLLSGELGLSQAKSLSPRVLGNLLEQYPSPWDLEKRAETLLREGLSQSEIERVSHIIRSFMGIVYGKRYEYYCQALLLMHKAREMFPNLVKKEGSNGDFRDNPRKRSPQKRISTLKVLGEEITIDGAQDFKELYGAISKQGGVGGSRGYYNPGTLFGLIEAVRRGERGINTITRSDGLRKKVEELLAQGKANK